jgi:hypothetical protein
MPDRVPKDMPKHIKIPENISNKILKNMSDKIPKNMSDRIPEKLRIIKYINIIMEDRTK